MKRVFEPLEGRIFHGAGPDGDEIGYLVTFRGEDLVDFNEEELRQMLDAVLAAKRDA